MKKKRLISFIMAVAMVMSLAVTPVMAWSAKNTKCYTITTGNTTVYYSNSTSSGKKGTIFGSDEIKILSSYSNGFYYVDYPIPKGRKQGYILKSDVLIRTSASTRYATSKITTYRRNNTKNTYGSIYKDDEVLVFGTRGDFTQIRYPVSGGYKFAWIKNSDANNYLKKTKAVNPTSVSLKVKLTNGSMYSNNGGFYLNGSSSSAQMKAVVSPSNANQSVTWSSGNTGIVKISSSGYATPVSNGTTTITARTVNGKTASASVTVINCVTIGPSDYKGSFTGTAEIGIFNGKNFYVFSQKDEEWGSYPYLKGTIGGKYQDTNIYHSGCHLLSLVNGTYWLTGKFISPKWLAKRAIDKGYRTNGDIDMKGLYKDISDNCGSKYGIEYVTRISSFSSLKKYLEKGYVGLGGGNGHVMAFVAYSGDKFLVLDSYYTYNGRSYVWKTQNQMTGRFNCSYFYIIKRR